ncbi:MAG TPA: hypothetical protein VNX68_18025 [Nitrosopumilaceae archaeon]|jgi:hypothetical protein|nr:hypothetical protein [Nitrosopumilaceae archaeon]
MEKKITTVDLPNLKVGQLFLVNAIFGEEVFVLSSIIETYKYPIGGSTGRKCRNKRIDDVLTSIYADEQGETGNEMIMEYGFLGTGSLTLDALDDFEVWNIRLIDEAHPKYNKVLSENGKQFSKILHMFDGNNLDVGDMCPPM